MGSFLITQIPLYSSYYTQYFSVCYPWLGQHVVDQNITFSI
jgi:hypothetical protein